jgi:hypothetical protein
MFKAHGEFELEIIDSIFVVNIKGAWNIENLHGTLKIFMLIHYLRKKF